MANALLTQLDAVKGFLLAMEGTETFEEAVQSQQVAVLATISNVSASLTMDDKATVVTRLRQMPWPAKSLRALLQQVNATAGSRLCTSGRRRRVSPESTAGPFAITVNGIMSGTADEELQEFARLMEPFADRLRAAAQEWTGPRSSTSALSQQRMPEESRQALALVPPRDFHGRGSLTCAGRSRSPHALEAGSSVAFEPAARQASREALGRQSSPEPSDADADDTFRRFVLEALPARVQSHGPQHVLAPLVARDRDWLSLRLPDPRASIQAGKIGMHCVSQIGFIIELACSFKIGTTANPHNRWHMAGGYGSHGYRKMHLLACSLIKEEIDMLEFAMILHFQHRDGCENIAPGGEGPSISTPPHFLYLAWKPY